MSFLFKREDTGEVIELPFSYVMEQDILGLVTLPDGTQAKRCVRLEIERDGKPKAVRRPEELNKPIVSDALGFCESQLSDFEADRKANGFDGVEFVRDKGVPQFFQVKFSSHAEWAKYVKHRGMIDRNGRNGGGHPITADQLLEAERRAKEMYPEKKPLDGS